MYKLPITWEIKISMHQTPVHVLLLVSVILNLLYTVTSNPGDVLSYPSNNEGFSMPSSNSPPPDEHL